MWHRLLARWASGDPVPIDGAIAFTSVDDESRLWLTPSGSSDDGERTGCADCVPFALRSAHSDAASISLHETPYLLAVRVYTPSADRDEFRRWLDEEHARLQTALPGVNWYLGYEQADETHSFLNLWGIDDPALVDSEAWFRIRDTEWWARLSHVPDVAVRGVYRPQAVRSG
jgi:hypothetical protein